MTQNNFLIGAASQQTIGESIRMTRHGKLGLAEYHYLASDSVLHIRQSQLPDESFSRNIRACFLLEKINN